jgi:DNA-binding MarR family transcriptional regulator
MKADEKLPLDSMPAQLVEAFSSFGPGYLRWAESCMRGSETTYTRMRLLGVLYCNGPQTMAALGEELGVTRRNITTLVDAVEAEGQVRRCPHPSDRRSTIVELTVTGTELVAEGYAEQVIAVADLFNDLPESRQRELLTTLMLLRDGLRRRGIVP